MKTNLLAVAFFLTCICNGQTIREVSTGILPDGAFDRMIIQDITYAIFGESNPVTGIKLDVSKPEATLSGVLNLNKQGSILLGVDFKGGITDKNFSIFKGTNTFNTAFEIRPALHIIPAWNYAKFKPETTIIKAKIDLVGTASDVQEDTFNVARLIYNRHLGNFPELLEAPNETNASTLNERQKHILVSLANMLVRSNLLQFHLDDQFRQAISDFTGFVDTADVTDSEREVLQSVATVLQLGPQTKIVVDNTFPEIFDALVTVTYKGNFNQAQRRVLQALVKRLEKREKFRYSINESATSILEGIGVALKVENKIDPTTVNDDVIDLYEKQKAKHLNTDSKLDKQIKIAATAWTSKQYFWLTFSPFARTEKLNLYQTKFGDKDSTYFKQEYPFFYGVGISISALRVHPSKRAQYLKFGITAAHANNITTLSSFTYETRSSFFTYGRSITEKVKTGTAYNASEVKSDFLFQVGAEYYLLPINTFLPGLYLSGSINISSLYHLKDIDGRINDKTQIPLEGGLVFNINNRDKDKSLLSISMYGRFEDATDRRRTETETKERESRDEFQKRNLSFGIKVGIPIALPKRS